MFELIVVVVFLVATYCVDCVVYALGGMQLCSNNDSDVVENAVGIAACMLPKIQLLWLACCPCCFPKLATKWLSNGGSTP